MPRVRGILIALGALCALTSCRFVESAKQKWNDSRALDRFAGSLEFSRFVNAEFPTNFAEWVPEQGLRRLAGVPGVVQRGAGTAAQDAKNLLTPPEDVAGRFGRRVDSLVTGPERAELARGGMQDPSDFRRATGAGPLDPGQQKSQMRRLFDRIRF